MAEQQLARRLGTVDSVLIGLGSMIGAGVFAAFAPAAAAAGSGLLIGLVLAGVIAFCNATSSAQLAAQYPSSGGTYLYGREQLGPWWGFLAGWGFVIGKTASCAAMALTFAAYVVPEPWQRPVAVAAVIVLAAVNYRGITRTAGLTKIIVAVVLAVLAFVIIAAWAGAPAAPAAFTMPDGPAGWYGVLQSAGLLFFAFAGYARIATLGEEVREPERTIPQAIVIALSLVIVVYVVVAVTLLRTLGADATATSTAPLTAVVDAAGWVDWPVRVGAAAAALGALLALIAGVGRTSLAMARNADLPPVLSAVHQRYRVPHRAEMAVAVAVCLLILVSDLRGAIGFSSFGVLIYYAVANLSAYSQSGEHRRFAKPLQVLGGVGCLVLVATLPWTAVVTGLAVFAVGAAYRLVVLRARPPERT